MKECQNEQIKKRNSALEKGINVEGNDDYKIIKARKNASGHEYTLNDVALEIDDNFTSETTYDNLLKKDVTQHQFKLCVNYLTDFSNFGEYTLNGYFVSYEENNDNVKTYFETDTPVYIYPDVTTTGSKKAYGWNRLFNWSIAAEKMNVIESTFSTKTLTPDDEDKYTLDAGSFEALTGFFQDSMRAYELQLTDLPEATYYDFAGWDYYLGNPEELNFAKADGRILYDSAKEACIFNTKNVHENVVLVPVFNYHNYTITFTSDIEGAESYELSANHFNGIKLKATPYIVGASGGYYYLDEILQIPEWYTIKGWLNNVDEYTLTDTFYPEEDTVFEAIYTENTEFPDLRFQIRQSNGSKETLFDSATQNISVLDVKFVEFEFPNNPELVKELLFFD